MKEYSKAQCQRNAEIEGVSDRVDFLKASTAELPFYDGEFNIIVNCLIYHEVKDIRNKAEVIIEALRVLEPGGVFIFLDMFMDRLCYN